MSRFLRDLGMSLRRLLRQPKYMLITIITLAVGIGANAAIFSVLNAVILEPLPYAHADRLTLVWSANQEEGWDQTTLSYPDYVDWHEQQRAFDSLGVFTFTGGTLTGIEAPRRVLGAYVSSALFADLGVDPQAGRTFTPSGLRTGEAGVIVISDTLWRESLGADPSVVGQSIQVNGEPLTVIGVMPPDFTFPPRISFQSNPLPFPADFWRPVEPWAQQFGRGSRLFFGAGRLASGTSPEQAESDLNTIAARLGGEYPDSNRGWTVDVESLHGHVVRPVRPALIVFSLAVALILILACANVANLLLAQSTERASEMAVRLAMGSSRSDLTRERVAEGLVLAFLAGSLGLLVAKLTTDLLVRVAAGQVPRMVGFELEPRVIVFTGVLTLVIGLFLGFLPMFQHARIGLADVLKSGGLRSSGGVRLHRLRQTVIAVEAAVALVLLVSAATLLQGYRKLEQVDPGFDADGLLVVEMALSEGQYPEPRQILGFFDRLSERLRSRPETESVAWVNVLPLHGNLNNGFQIPGRPATESENLRANLRSVSPSYFDAMGIPVVEGRAFDAGDDSNGAPVAIINETMARQFWPDRDPIGEQVVAEGYPGSGRGALGVDSTARIVGIVGDVRHAGFDQDAAPTLYVPFLQDPNAQAGLLVRTKGDPAAFSGTARASIREIDGNVPVDSVITMNEMLNESLGNQRFRAVLLTVFALAALVLAITGMYSIVSYAASRRAREIGIRMSLGAHRSDIVRNSVARGTVPVVVGLVLGLVALFWMSRAAASVVADLATLQPLVIVGAGLLVLVIASVANYLPARRLGKTNPVTVLRYE